MYTLTQRARFGVSRQGTWRAQFDDDLRACEVAAFRYVPHEPGYLGPFSAQCIWYPEDQAGVMLLAVPAGTPPYAAHLEQTTGVGSAHGSIEYLVGPNTRLHLHLPPESLALVVSPQIRANARPPLF